MIQCIRPLLGKPFVAAAGAATTMAAAAAVNAATDAFSMQTSWSD